MNDEFIAYKMIGKPNFLCKLSICLVYVCSRVDLETGNTCDAIFTSEICINAFVCVCVVIYLNNHNPETIAYYPLLPGFSMA